MVGTVAILLESAFYFPVFTEYHVLSYACMGVMAFTTLFSGIDYLRAYLPHIDTNK